MKPTLNPMLTPEEIAAIRERAEKATSGPWQYEQYEVDPLSDTAKLYYSGSEKPFADFRGDLNQDQDAEFIAHARTDIPALLANIEELEQALYKISQLCPPRCKTCGYPNCKINHVPTKQQ